MTRATFLVDGFNVYHSAKQASHDLNGASTRWLNLRALLSSYLPVIGGGMQLEGIYYFSALATHLDARKPGLSTRHRLYIECLQSTGVQIELARFKCKSIWCSQCNNHRDAYEEKETDVALSVKLLELFHADACDTIVLVSGDTDLAPAVRAAARMFPAKTVCFAFPYRRKNAELATLVNKHFRIKKDRYVQHQFPDSVVLPSGRTINKPDHW